MSKLFNFTFVCLLAINTVFTYKMFKMMTSLKESVAFDVDKARTQYEQDVKYLYGRGCRIGTEYVPKDDKNPAFDFHNPVAYCQQQMEKDTDILTEKLFILGKEVR